MCSASTKHDYAHTKTLMQTEELFSNCLLKSVKGYRKQLYNSPQHWTSCTNSWKLKCTLSLCFHTNTPSGQKSKTTSQKAKQLVFGLPVGALLNTVQSVRDSVSHQDLHKLVESMPARVQTRCRRVFSWDLNQQMQLLLWGRILFCCQWCWNSLTAWRSPLQFVAN